MIPDRETLEKRRKKLEEELARAVDALREMGAERVVLIGSMTRDPINPLGDIDLVVIMRTDKRFLDRLKEVYSRIQPRVAMDILVYTPEEFEELGDSSPFLSHALKGGRVLHVA